MRHLLAVALLAVTGCTVGPQPRIPAEYDFGPLVADREIPPRLGRELVVHEVAAPSWIDTNAMLYRLAYEDMARPRGYAGSRWVAPPPQLITSRLRSRAAAASSAGIAPPGESPRGAAVLSTELEEFSQVFDLPDRSRAVVRLRATLSERGRILGQRSFTVERAAVTPDAAGGARALALAADAAVDQVVDWAAGELRR